MARDPISEDIGATLARLFFGGKGSSHAKLTAAFVECGFSDDDPYDPSTQTPNKEVRVRTVLRAAARRPQRSRQLIEAMLRDLRTAGQFDALVDDDPDLRRLREAFEHRGWTLTDSGQLRQLGPIDLDTGGRPALDEQLSRLQSATDDPALLLGSAKDLLESVAKFVLEELGYPLPKNPDYGHLWYLARERLSILPQQVPADLPGASSVRAILQNSWAIADQVNTLRNLQGVGHGRTLPTGVSAELALLVVREACSVAEFTLHTLDRNVGRGH